LTSRTSPPTPEPAGKERPPSAPPI